jgi:hypothetical protein
MREMGKTRRVFGFARCVLYKNRPVFLKIVRVLSKNKVVFWVGKVGFVKNKQELNNNGQTFLA